VWGRVRRGRFIVGTCSTMSIFFVGTCTPLSAKCRDAFDEVVLVSGRVRRGLLNVQTCLASSG